MRGHLARLPTTSAATTIRLPWSVIAACAVAKSGMIARLAGQFASLLTHRGIVQGDRVMIWAENSAEWIAAFHGCMLRGVLAVPLDAGAPPISPHASPSM